MISDSVPLEDLTSVYSTNEDSSSKNNQDHAQVFRDGHVLEITTKVDGFNAGRSYLLKTKHLRVAEVSDHSSL